MKKHYYILGLKEGASQEEIQEAYERLSKELDPANNDNQEFFVEEFKKVQEAYKELSNSSILATDKGAKQIFKKPNSTSKKNSDATKTPTKEKLDTPKKKIVKRDVALFFIAIGIWGLLLQNMGVFDYIQKEYQKAFITTMQRRALELRELTKAEQQRLIIGLGITNREIKIVTTEDARVKFILEKAKQDSVDLEKLIPKYQRKIKYIDY